jgi:hypothetical protein
MLYDERGDMEVRVEYKGRVYRYCNVGNMHNWVDHKNVVVPVFLHADLRQAAIEAGTDPNVFIRKLNKIAEKSVKKNRVRKTKARKGSVVGGMTLASLLKKGEKTNGTE